MALLFYLFGVVCFIYVVFVEICRGFSLIVWVLVVGSLSCLFAVVLRLVYVWKWLTCWLLS